MIRILLSMYLAFVFVGKAIVEVLYRKRDMMAREGMSYLFVVYLLVLLAVAAVFYLLLTMLHSRSRALILVQQQPNKRSVGLFIGVFAAVLGVYLMYYYMYYPFEVSGDVLTQWEQAHSMNINDHHPAFHTLLICLGTQVVDSYPFLIFVQLILFAAGVAWLAVTLRAWGVPALLVALVTFLIAYGVHTRAIMFYTWKDTAMSLQMLFLLSQMVNLFWSRGEWLKKPLHWISMAVLLAGITLVRHNAVLFTFPLIVLLFVTYPRVRKSSALAAGLCLLLVLGVKGPLYHVFRVTPSPNNYSETIGLPMTILSSVYSEEPEQLSEEAYAFMSAFAPQEEFKERYEFGNYNSVKWAYVTQEKLSELAPSPLQVLSMTWDAIRAESVLAARSVLALTDIVWDPTMDEVAYIGALAGQPSDTDFLRIVPKLEMLCYDVTDILYQAFSNRVFNVISSQIGFLMLVMLLAWYASRKVHGLTGLWLILPVLAYNFGTMLLLCGDDARFFHFNCLIAYPIAILLMSRNAQERNEE